MQNAAETIAWRAEEASSNNRPQSPLYQQIYLIIRNNILNGKYLDGDFLPSEHEITKMFGVSRITAKRTLNDIAAEGLCVRKRGHGSRVTYKPSAPPLKADAQGLLDYLAQDNPQTEGAVLEFGYLPATEEIARIFRIDTETEIQRSIRVRHLDETPFSYLTTYVPADLGQKFNQHDLVSHAVLTLLEQTGVNVARAEQDITATLATAPVAKALKIKLASPLLRVSRVVTDTNNRVVEYIIGLYRPDQYQYQEQLSRITTGDDHTWSASD
jgi:GntR family transcriptional regulator